MKLLLYLVWNQGYWATDMTCTHRSVVDVFNLPSLGNLDQLVGVMSLFYRELWLWTYDHYSFILKGIILMLWFHSSFTEDICRWSNSFFFSAASIVEGLGPVLKGTGFCPSSNRFSSQINPYFSLVKFIAIVDFYNLPDRIKSVIHFSWALLSSKSFRVSYVALIVATSCLFSMWLYHVFYFLIFSNYGFISCTAHFSQIMDWFIVLVGTLFPDI